MERYFLRPRCLRQSWPSTGVCVPPCAGACPRSLLAESWGGKSPQGARGSELPSHRMIRHFLSFCIFVAANDQLQSFPRLSVSLMKLVLHAVSTLSPLTVGLGTLCTRTDRTEVRQLLGPPVDLLSWRWTRPWMRGMFASQQETNLIPTLWVIVV